MKLTLPTAIVLLLLCIQPCVAQDILSSVVVDDNSSKDIVGISDKFLGSVSRKVANLEKKLAQQSKKYLQKISRQERKLRNKLDAYDSAGSNGLMNFDISRVYGQLKEGFNADSSLPNLQQAGQYLPYADSLQGILSYLNLNPQLLKTGSVSSAELQGLISRLNLLQRKMQYADRVREFVVQRKQQLSQYLTRYTNLPKGILRAYKGYTKEAYYYAAQLREYKEILNNPDKALKLALSVLNRIPAFSSFMQKHSVLAGLFALPGDPNSSSVVPGLPSRSQVLSAFQSQAGSSSNFNTASLVQGNVQTAQQHIDALRNKLPFRGNGGNELEMPDFKPNTQRTKSFFERFEFGTNLQTAQSTNFFPITTDLALSAGYKLSDKNIIGIGASYKIGWGKDIKHVALSSQGVGFRSFVDINMKKSFYASGGFEYNYQKPFAAINTVLNLHEWQQSGLLGLTKIVSLKTNLFKKTKVQLLWDFLSYQQVPRSQPFKFRVGYNF